MNFDGSCIYHDFSSKLRVAVAAVRFVKFKKYNFKLFSSEAVKPLAINYIDLVLKFMYEDNNKFSTWLFVILRFQTQHTLIYTKEDIGKS